MKVLKINKSSFVDSGNRLDASYHLSDGPITKIKLKKSPYKAIPLSGVTQDIFKGNIFKRTYVEDSEYGFRFLTASDMMKLNINGENIYRKSTLK